MSLVNDDINQLDAITNNQVKILAIYFYGYLKGKGYHADCYSDKNTDILENIEFYEYENDKSDSNEKARYSFSVAQKWVLFYFKKPSELPSSYKQMLADDFGDDFKPNPNKRDEFTVRIRTLDKAKLLTDKYIKAS